MYTYYQVSRRVVVNSCIDLYIHCKTLKLAMHIANIEWSTYVQREVLYTYNKVRLQLLQLNAWARTPNCTTPKLVSPLGTHHVEHNTMHYVCTHTTRSALRFL